MEEKQMKEIKSLCCNAKIIRKGRADLRCEKCGKDVTLEIVMLYDLIIDTQENKEAK